eukprot:scpid46475/ scgid8170/ Uncharacterized protein K02A2.6
MRNGRQSSVRMLAMVSVLFCCRTTTTVFVQLCTTSTEQQYAQIEKECLAVVWACERFHGFVYGDPSLTVHTDHKPLIPLINTRDLNRVPLRCQRLLMRLMKYNPAAVYIPGKQLVVADALSRAPDASVDTPTSQLAEEISLHISTITSEIVSARKAEELAANTAADTVLQQVLQYTKSGWPDSAHLVEDAVRPFFHERALLSCSNGILYHGTRIVIPPKQRASILATLHEGHQGTMKCKALARNSVWWPGLAKEVDALVAACPVCCKHRLQHSEPLQPVPRPQLPWHTIGCDLMEHNSKVYLLVVDYFSRFLDVIPLRSTTSASIVSKLHGLFATHGIPACLVSDNGPQFASADFRSFAHLYDFSHRTSSPRYPQSNGEAGRAVRTAKNHSII